MKPKRAAGEVDGRVELVRGKRQYRTGPAAHGECQPNGRAWLVIPVSHRTGMPGEELKNRGNNKLGQPQPRDYGPELTRSLSMDEGAGLVIIIKGTIRGLIKIGQSQQFVFQLGST